MYVFRYIKKIKTFEIIFFYILITMDKLYDSLAKIYFFQSITIFPSSSLP